MSETGISVDFAPSIASYARAHHLDLSMKAADSLAQTLSSLMQVDDGHVTFAIGHGRTSDITAALDLFTVGAPRTAQSSSTVDGHTATAKVVAKVRDARAGQAAATAQAAAAGGNPWSAPTFNRTAQAIISNTNPALAKQLKAQAGIQ